jgi:FKBP-type peptidyl-prolyl cis-trans isomerase FkpA
MRLAVFAALASLAAPPLARAQALKTEDEKVAYALGMVAARSFLDLKLTPKELEIMKRGLTDALAGGKTTKVDLATYEPKVQEFARKRIEESRKRLAEEAEKEAPKHREAGKAFAEAAAKEKDAVKTDSGLVYTSLREGSGESPKTTDTVKVDYEGRLTDGKVFDSSYKRGQPAEFQLSGVIPCWTEGLQKMKAGGKARLVCPSSIAYRDAGRPPVIPGGATLVFDVELLSIKK